MRILIDNGHGIETLGKRSPDSSLVEWHYTREIACAVAMQLRLRGYDALLLTPEEEDISLKERVRRANDHFLRHGIGDVILVSIHVNAAGMGDRWLGARGWCAYTSNGSTRADALATCLYKAAQKHLPTMHLRTDHTDGDPDYEKDFFLLKKTVVPSVLVENLFMDNREDCAFLLSDAGRAAIIALHVDGIISFVQEEGG